MRILTSMLRGLCTYWPPLRDGANLSGQPTYGDPRELRCRWEDSAVTAVDPAGRVTVSKALIYLGEDVRQGGVLLLAPLTAVENLSDPYANRGPEGEAVAFEVVRFEKMPTLKKRGEFVRIAYL